MRIYRKIRLIHFEFTFLNTTYRISFRKFNEFLDCKGVVWVLIWMHNKRLSTVSLLDGAHVSIIVDLEDCEWVKGLDVLEGGHSLVVQVPEVPEEGSDDDLVVEGLLEHA